MIATTLKSFAFSLVAVAAATASAFAAAPSAVNLGDQSRWSLDFRVRLEQQSAPSVEIHVTGDWVWTVVALRPGEYDTQLQIDDVRFTADGMKKPTAPSLEDLRLRLSRPFWATYRADGGLLAIHFFRDANPSDCNLLQMIATELQLVQPDSERASWAAQERDGAGEYSALYARPQVDRILKKKLKYFYLDGMAGAAANSVRVVIDESSVTFSMAPNGGVQLVDGTSRMHIDLALGPADQLTIVTEIHLRNRRAVQAPDLIGSLARSLPNVVSSAIVTHTPSPAEVQAEADTRLLEGHATESLLAEAFADHPTDTALSARLTAAFRRRPEAASDAVILLTMMGAQKRVTDALAAAGSPAAVAALATIARNSSLDENLRVDTIVAFVQMQHPTAEAMRVPVDLMNDSNPAIQSAARMISGALARAGHPEHPAEADAIDTSLVALYRRARTAREKVDVLGALGNSVGPLVVPVIVEALHDSDASVRGAAARALRLAPGSDVDRLLANVMTSDSDPAVRANAIFAARFRRPLPAPLVDALLHEATGDSIVYVRSDAVALISLNPRASADISETLARIADSDSNTGIRRQAREALTAIRKAGSSTR
jgi:HEAT repeat protein